MVTSENLMAMATRPQIHIHKSAPGPPVAIAAPTPAILPVPMVEPRAAVTAWNGETPRAFFRACSSLSNMVPAVFFMMKPNREN